ncbi:hypothetical protein B9Z55_012608 [Caenorhabditis nigoni]|uniref:FAD/NAD(P)-binding domain-containing protein n=1 Tax=Caenorhabditis nigoni TaxID=1611254 RepID=A0A2G5TZ21_9PELO|nr:hypothetical protein B9Z55_012608 [Caenorhabditis nigoni]
MVNSWSTLLVFPALPVLILPGVKTFWDGNAIYTYPNGPIKCAGAPQKSCYITDSILRQRGVQENAHMIYATSLDKYSLLHIGPPCSAPKALRKSPFADKTGFMDVDGGTLQSKKFPNVFGVGDCMNTPNAKTAASVSSHLKTLDRNLTFAMLGKKPYFKYDGYASCPLVVSKNRVILAEFNSKGPLETTPLNEEKPAYWAFLLKKYFMPALYWNGLIRGYWNGPATIRKFSRLVDSKKRHGSCEL